MKNVIHPVLFRPADDQVCKQTLLVSFDVSGQKLTRLFDNRAIKTKHE